MLIILMIILLIIVEVGVIFFRVSAARRVRKKLRTGFAFFREASRPNLEERGTQILSSSFQKVR